LTIANFETSHQTGQVTINNGNGNGIWLRVIGSRLLFSRVYLEFFTPNIDIFGLSGWLIVAAMSAFVIMIQYGSFARGKIFYEGMQAALRGATIDENKVVLEV